MFKTNISKRRNRHSGKYTRPCIMFALRNVVGIVAGESRFDEPMDDKYGLPLSCHVYSTAVTVTP